MAMRGNQRDFLILTNNPMVSEIIARFGKWTVQFMPEKSYRDILVLAHCHSKNTSAEKLESRKIQARELCPSRAELPKYAADGESEPAKKKTGQAQ